MDRSKKTWVIDGYLWLNCPVCGTEVMDYDICDVCRWQNTGIINIDGGPNKIPRKTGIALQLQSMILKK